MAMTKRKCNTRWSWRNFLQSKRKGSAHQGVENLLARYAEQIAVLPSAKEKEKKTTQMQQWNIRGGQIICLQI